MEQATQPGAAEKGATRSKPPRGVIPIASSADLIDGVDEPGIASQGSETPGFVT
jgi:hypothetical protein